MKPMPGKDCLPKNYEGKSTCFVIADIYPTGNVKLSDAECYHPNPVTLSIDCQTLIDNWVQDNSFMAPMHTRLYKQSKIRITKTIEIKDPQGYVLHSLKTVALSTGGV